MMENKEMIYTAIFQNGQGQLSYETYNGTMNRKDAWLNAASKGGANDKCLIALVPGVHPVYFYDDFVSSVAADDKSEVQKHDLFEVN